MTTPVSTTMTTGGSSRHMACKPCRDRKVRCGGEQPICDKCRRAGEHCDYLPTQKPTKADLAHKVEALQRRLDEAEAYIRATQSRASSSRGVTVPSPHGSDWLVNPDAQCLPSSSDGQSPAVPTQSSSSGPIFQDSPQAAIDQPAQRRQCAALIGPFQGDGDLDMSMDPNGLDFFPHDSFVFQRGLSEEGGAAVLEPLKSFTSAVFRSQAEQSVMATVVADYLAWLRKAPPGGGIPAAAENPVYLGMLETLEKRLRELCDASRSRGGAAVRELVAALEAVAPPGGAMAARLGSLEEDVQKEALEHAAEFRARYNPCALLSKQFPSGSP
ncbi:hypothetical protein KVR01_006187 [Diaporthe batatas]|uniref:uncharacterized protein n=1 Tax=Diaporthe batatas TaxID=748121 RepID=UPI001D0454E6|nr:uncharacterized protein KVR01_006187 [Diaporthe batatas]KAG8164269.1 hypothetical protein KVR01_006187 [Diaporthe batatas]